MANPSVSDSDDAPRSLEVKSVDGNTPAEENAAAAASPPTHRPRQGLSRRGFLLTAAGAGAAVVASACGRDRVPTSTLPTPTATQAGGVSLPPTPIRGGEVYLPFVENGAPAAGAAVSPVATPETPTSTPTETPTQPPPPTPTPPATPFPPGPPSKLGLFVARNHPQIFELLATKAITVIKTLELDVNFAAQIKSTSPATRLIGRIDLPQIDLPTLDPMAAARDYMAALLPIADNPERRRTFDGWEAYNEPVAVNADEMKRLADFEAERTRRMAAEGLRSVIANFGTGLPPLELWEPFLPAVQAAKEHDGWLGLHEYSAPTIYYLSTRADQGRYPGVSPQDTGWLTLRYRKVYNDILRPRGLDIPLVLTELGVDGLVTDRPGPPDAMGWQDFQTWWAENGYGLWGPGAYVEQLVWYDQAMRQDDYVLGSAIFAMAASSGWHSYDILGAAGAVLQQYLSVHTPA